MAVLYTALPRLTPDVAPTLILVGLGESRAVRASSRADETLMGLGLGSCIAICLFDPDAQVAGMAHVVLPGADPTGAPNAKYARNALPALVASMQQLGAGSLKRYTARLVGGARILSLDRCGTLPRVGDLNVTAVLEVLGLAGIPVHGADLGGTKGRSVWFNPRQGGQIRVRTIGSDERCL